MCEICVHNFRLVFHCFVLYSLIIYSLYFFRSSSENAAQQLHHPHYQHHYHPYGQHKKVEQTRSAVGDASQQNAGGGRMTYRNVMSMDEMPDLFASIDSTNRLQQFFSNFWTVFSLNCCAWIWSKEWTVMDVFTLIMIVISRLQGKASDSGLTFSEALAMYFQSHLQDQP